MVQSILEQKRPLSVFASEHNLPATLSSNQWALMEKMVTVLAPFEEITRAVSAQLATAADVIPTVTVLKRVLSREQDSDQGIRTMKNTLLEVLNRRFKDVEKEPIYSIATLLDPRYKDRHFDGDVKQRARATLEAHLMSAAGAGDQMHDREKADHPQRKRARTDRARHTLHDMFVEILEEHGPERPRTTASQQVSLQRPTFPEVSFPQSVNTYKHQ